MTGQTLGHYRVFEEIGSGGMGEVYRASDDRLGRDVALKVLKSSLAHDQDRLRRFELEARAAAALNHPNIVAIYDIGMHEGAPYIVSELLQGQTLRKRLLEGPLALRQVADYGIQIAQGLTAAHEKRIVHRDLKPENLFLTKDGRIKILDFGIAKLTLPEQNQEQSDDRVVANMTTQTKAGSVLGTVAYMSPEQLRAKTVDHRSDIFSLGAILYEMLTGKRAFSGETNVDTMTAVLKDEPAEMALVRQSIPPAFEQIVRHCLEKEADNRFQSARDLAFALSTVSDVSTSKQVAALREGKSRWRRWLPWVAATLLLGALGVLLGRLIPTVPSPVYRRLTFERGTIYSARFSADGRNIVYSAAWNGGALHLYSSPSDAPQEHGLEVNDAQLLAVSRTDEMALALHGKHGAHLEFVNGTLARAPLAGGAPREILEDVRWADWSPKGELAVVDHAKGRSRLEFPIGNVIYESGGWISHIRFSPQGDRIAFLDHPALWDDRGSVCVVDLAGHRKTLASGWESEDGLAWNPRGDEVWFTAVEGGYNRALMAASLSGRLRKVLSVPGGLTLQDISADGRVMLTLENERLAMEAAVEGRKGAQDLSWYDWTVPRDISTDGQWVLFEESSEPIGPRYAVALRKLDGSPPVRLGEGSAGGLSPDGKWALSVFIGTPEKVTLLPTGAGQPRDILLPSLEHVQNGPAHFSPDGKQIIVNGNEPGHAVRAYAQDLSGGNPRAITPEGVVGSLVSPNGLYVAGLGAATSLAVYPINGGKERVIPGLETGFTLAQWSADSSALYVYRTGELPTQIYRVDIATGKRQLVREIMPASPTGVVSISPIVMSPDASRFVYGYYQTLSVLYVVSGLK
jgi:serine/threonine protein kinase/Tol biopolymer transport system component